MVHSTSKTWLSSWFIRSSSSCTGMLSVVVVISMVFLSFLHYCSLAFFLSAILAHCVLQTAVSQLIVAVIFALYLLFLVPLYWLITEPCNDIDSLEHRFVTVTGERKATTTAN